ncbi:hypothetical protein UNPF46_15380 [Bradyrhizobium sp. UNPF46]|nr:hypothetical protein UNPF46_15380 [Bradyrhizobium sp. UNPF46]
MSRPLYSRPVELGGAGTTESFTKIYTENIWGESASLSGSGSIPGYTDRLQSQLPNMLAKLDVKTFLDAPCGDFAWMRSISLPVERYVGGDIVPPLIDELNQRYGNDNRTFLQIDITSSPLPRADLWMCRDCFIHLPNDLVLAALRNFAQSEISYLLTTQYNFGRRNTDIAVGSFRLINLRRPPFNLPSFRDSIVDYVDPFPPRRLALWTRDDVRKALAAC